MRFFITIWLLLPFSLWGQLSGQMARWQEDSTQAQAAHDEGVALFRQQAYEASLAPYRRAISLRDRCFPKGHNSAAQSRYNLAQSFRRLGQIDSAAYYLEESNQRYAQLSQPDTMRWVRTLNTLGLIYADIGDIALLKAANAKATALATRYYTGDPYELADVYYLAAQGCHSLSAWQDMLQYASKGLQYAQQAADPYQISYALNQLASAHLAREEFAAALDLYQQELALSQSLEMAPEDLALLHYNYGLCLLSLEKYTAAAQWIVPLLQMSAVQEDSSLLASVCHLRAHLAAKAKQYTTAETFFTKALGLLQADWAWRNIDSLDSRTMRELAYVYEDRAHFLTLNNRLQEALEDYQRMLTYLDRIRLDLDNQDAQQFISRRLRQAFQDALHLHYLLYQQEQDPAHLWKALALAERSKAFSLLAAIRQSSADRSQNEVSLRRKITKLERDPSQQQVLATAQLELARLQKIRGISSQQPPVLVAAELQAYLRQQGLHLLEYALGEEVDYVFHLSPQGDIAMYPLSLGADFAAEIQQYRQAIQASAYKQKSLNNEQQRLDMAHAGAAFSLWSKVFPKALYQPSGAAEKLLIIPDGVLGYLPFPALLTQAVEAPIRYEQLPYLKNKWHISLSYSAQYLLELAKKPKEKAGQNVLALAPTFATRGSEVTRGLDSSEANRAFSGLLPLRYNTEEVQGICQLLPRSEAYIGAEAQRLLFEEKAAHYRILHLASHAIVNADQPKQSFIAFTQLGDSLQTTEVLYLNDLYNYSLSADLAVLSACETNLGAFVPGEGVLSLARAFAQAGAQSTLTSLWKVDDEATKVFMLAYYTALKNQESRSEALAIAQQSLAGNKLFAHPYYWSAFTLYGKPDALELLAAEPNYLPLLGGTVLILLLSFFLRRLWKPE